ncbi:MAG: hypothetical protein J6S08_04320 [Duodenibacillus sp.]|nr:hypothetical protein [Duodenibacillus sp.]
MHDLITDQERKTLSVLAFLFYRMGMEERAKRVYAALAELSEPGSSDYRFAMAGLAAVAVELGDGDEAFARVKEAMKGGPLSSRDVTLHLIKGQALWLQGRKEEAQAARDEYLYLSGQNGQEVKE